MKLNKRQYRILKSLEHGEWREIESLLDVFFGIKKLKTLGYIEHRLFNYYGMSWHEYRITMRGLNFLKKNYNDLVYKVAMIMSRDSGSLYDNDPLYWNKQASNVIEVVREYIEEPSANQEQAGMSKIIDLTGYVNHDIYVDPETPYHTWKAMLQLSGLYDGKDHKNRR